MSDLVIGARHLCLFTLLLVGCGSRGEGPPIGEGFVAPASLNLRQELGPRQPSVATVRHGERVEILAKRRRFVKVRTRAGAVGWVNGDLLFSPEQMGQLRQLAERTVGLPSQGDATGLDTLNVHTQPDRQAPIFQQVREGQHVAVVEHRLVTTPARTEDWSLVRISAANAGWVVTRMLVMSIPDEVAQYAEGHRITSYFALGEVQDGDRVKKNWLWTTIEKGGQPYEFDSARVFVWSLRRHRYETAFIQRKLKGFYPVEVRPEAGSPASFSLLVEESDGARYRRTYAFQGYHVRLLDKTLLNPIPESSVSKPARDEKAAGQAKSGLLARTWQRLTSTVRRWLGK